MLFIPISYGYIFIYIEASALTANPVKNNATRSQHTLPQRKTGTKQKLWNMESWSHVQVWLAHLVC